MTNIDDILKYRTLIEEAEKIRYDIIGSSTVICDIFITETNDLVIVNSPVLYVTKIKNFIGYHPVIAYKSDTKILENLDNNTLDRYAIQFNDQLLIQYLSWLYKIYHCNSVDLPTLAVDQDLFSNESFMNIGKIKAADGLKYFVVNNFDTKASYKVPMYSGLFKAKAGDKLSITILDWDMGHLLNKVTICKKKADQSIDIYFRTLKFS